MIKGLSRPSLYRQDAFISGEWRQSKSKGCQEVSNPANLQPLAFVPAMGAAETEEAISAASKAFETWKLQLPSERANRVRKWADLMRDHKEDLALILTSEQGKVLSEARGEIEYAASFLEWFAEEARRIYGDIIPPHQSNMRLSVIKQPIGVVGAITPWNFPAAMITRKVGPAIAAGCTMVLKPAMATPLTAFALADLSVDAGIPPGVFNVITGSAREIGATLTSSPDVTKITFTGSTEVGRVLLQQSAQTVKKVSMELGGNAPFIVFEDADLDRAVEGAIASKFRNAGQTCVCTNRIYAHEDIYEQFTSKLETAVSALKVEDGLVEGAEIGPLIDAKAIEKVQEHIEDAISKGAKVTVGGNEQKRRGHYFEPTVLRDANQGMEFAREETFGPIAAVIPFSSEQEVISFANDTEFGLAAYFYANDVSRVHRVSEALEAGMIGVNTGLISTTVAPFGGIKQSGLGREGSKYGIDDFLETKYVCVAIDEQKTVA